MSSARKMQLSFLTDAPTVDDPGSSSSLASFLPPIRSKASVLESNSALGSLASLAAAAEAYGTAPSPSLTSSASTVVSVDADCGDILGALTGTSTAANECEVCGERFALKLRFLHHRLAVHALSTYAGKTVLPCGRCNAAFLRKTDRTKHTACVHDKKRPHKCLQLNCGSTFFFGKDLVKHHSTVHEKNKPFACTICDKRFGKREHMTSHVRRVHQKLKPFKCQVCDIRLASKYNLQGHLRTAAHASALRMKGNSTGKREEGNGRS